VEANHSRAVGYAVVPRSVSSSSGLSTGPVGAARQRGLGQLGVREQHLLHAEVARRVAARIRVHLVGLTSVGNVGVDRGLELVDQRDGRGGLLGRVADQGLRAIERPAGLGGRRAFVDGGVRRVRQRLEFEDS
jgi:hypothetical protein